MTTVINGGEGNDTLIGGAEAETFYAGGGNDIVDGNGGNDVAFLGKGDDVFIWDPGDGSDRVEGEQGYDTLLFNGSGADEIFDASANGDHLRFFRNVGNIVMDVDGVEQVTLNANGGKDAVTVNDLSATDVKVVNINLAAPGTPPAGDGQEDTVTVNGNHHPNTINVASGTNGVSVTGLAATVNISHAEAAKDKLIVNGLDGNDKIDASGLQANVIQLVVDGGKGNDTLLGGQGVETLIGGEGNDIADGNQGNDVAFLGKGDDVFVWDPGDGSDVVEGEEGIDTLRFNGSDATELFEVSNNGDRVRFFRNVGNIVMDLNSVERIEVNGRGGDDLVDATKLTTNAVQLIVDSGVGNDTVLGGAGNDTIRTGDGNDVVDGNQGSDTAFLGKGDDVFIWDPGDGSDRVEGEDGSDTLRFNGSNGDEIFDVSANGDRLRFFRNVGNIIIDGDSLEQVDLNAGGGKDSITVNNLSATDVKVVNVNLAAFGVPPTGDGQVDTVTVNGSHQTDFINVASSASGVSITGLAAKVNIAAAESTDELIINAGSGSDFINASELAPNALQLTLNGNAGRDFILGGQGDETLNGGSDSDTLTGGSGNDLLIGGSGVDLLIGGPGQDRYQFNAPNEGVDFVLGFAAADDRIQVSATGFGGGLTPGAAITAEQFRIGAAAGDASDRFIYNDLTGALFFDVDGAGGAAQVQIAALLGAPTISNANIVVV